MICLCSTVVKGRDEITITIDNQMSTPVWIEVLRNRALDKEKKIAGNSSDSITIKTRRKDKGKIDGIKVYRAKVVQKDIIKDTKNGVEWLCSRQNVDIFGTKKGKTFWCEEDIQITVEPNGNMSRLIMEVQQ